MVQTTQTTYSFFQDFKKKMNTSIRNVFCPQEMKHKRHNQGLKTEHKETEIYRIEKLVP